MDQRSEVNGFDKELLWLSNLYCRLTLFVLEFGRKFVYQCFKKYCLVHPSQFQHLHAFKKQSLIQDLSQQRCLLAFNKEKFVLHNKIECIWCQMDGFDQTVNVKVIMATNRADTLDPALLCPGCLDCNIEFPLPDRRQKCLIFQVCFLPPVLKFSFTCHFHCYGHYLDASQKNVKFLIGVWS